MHITLNRIGKNFYKLCILNYADMTFVYIWVFSPRRIHLMDEIVVHTRSILSATMYRNSVFHGCKLCVSQLYKNPVSHGCIQIQYINTTNNPSRSLTSQQRFNFFLFYVTRYCYVSHAYF